MSLSGSDIVVLNRENIKQEHLCCALGSKENQAGVELKKEWLTARFDEGLIFRKANVRGKVFIEYLPAEAAWSPIEAPGYMFINCLWVSGQYKGMGWGSKLLDQCMADSRGKNGIVVLSSKVKRPYLSDKAFFRKKGFEVCDTAPPNYELLVKRFTNAPLPQLTERAKKQEIEENEGLCVFYTNQCPFTEQYAAILAESAKECGIPITVKKISSKEEAQASASPYVTYSVFYQGRFLTHEIMSRDACMKMLKKLQPESANL